MTEPLNPYESPVVPDETENKSTVEPRGVIATFEMDAAAQWNSARVITAPIPGWLGWAAPVLILMFGYCMVMINYSYGGLGVLGFAIAVFVPAMLLQSFRSRRVAQHTLAMIREHPVLGATGTWRMKVSRHDIVVETSGGKESFTRAVTPVQSLEGSNLVFWFEGRLPIVIPDHGSYARMANALRQWIWKTTDAKPA